MENVSLKKGLFGYTQSSVQEYIEALNGELTARTNKFVLENEELKKKCEHYEDKINESNAKTGDKFTPSLRYFLPTDCRSSIKSPSSQG